MRTAVVRAAIPILLAGAACLGAAETSPPDAAEPAQRPMIIGDRPVVLRGPLKGDYPLGAAGLAREGWVIVNLMVGPDGKPYEASVVDSLGGPDFEREALRAVARGKFEPAASGGVPIHGSATLKLKFAIADFKGGAQPPFLSRYRLLDAALRAGDRKRSERLLADLEATNLYEDAFRNLALYYFHKAWGTTEDQLLYLRAAIAGEDRDAYLERADYVAALNAMLVLELRRNELGQALRTWRRLSAIAPEPVKVAWRDSIAQLEQARTNGKPFRYTGRLDRPSAFHPLFHRRFRLSVAEGRVDELKLRCDRMYIQFPYDATIGYSVPPDKGECMLEVIGEVGTLFDLAES